MASDMGVDIVHTGLCNSFPQVDPRILKAVALENPYLFAAVDVVVNEVLPYCPGITNLSNSSQKEMSSQPMSRAEGAGEQKADLEPDATPSCNGALIPNHASVSLTPSSEVFAQKCLDEVSKINNIDELLSFCKRLAHHLNVMPEPISRLTSIHEDLEGKIMSGDLCGEEGHSWAMAEELVPSTEKNDCSSLISHVIDGPDENQVLGNGVSSAEALDCDYEPEAVSGDEELIAVSDSELHQDNSVTDRYDFDVSVPANGLAFLPSQAKRIELLESSIEEAKTNKKTLFSSMEAVMNTMREVEEREKAAEKAKDEASEGGLEILSGAEELKTVLQKAKEANDMHTGEVYGERSILATEAKELQSRLANLAEERNEALRVLDEMRCSLETRLSATDEEIKKAEEERLDKENSAKKYFDEQEAIMDKILQETKLLQVEEEENLKLREFLVDRGRIVDTLQGEISVICQDVKSLKCKFDERVPLSESVSSGQTTCILASSSSSKRSISSQVLSDHEALSAPMTRPSHLQSLRAMVGNSWPNFIQFSRVNIWSSSLCFGSSVLLYQILDIILGSLLILEFRLY